VPDEDNGVVLSIVIPTLDAAAHLPGCLEALEAGRRTARDLAVVPPDIELVVVDGGSTDDTVAIAGRVGARVIAAPCGRGAQLAAGARAANGDWLLFLHADTRLAQGWLAAVAGFVNNPANPARAAAFRFALDDAGRAARLIEAAVAWRCRALALPYGDQGLLISRAFYGELGGYGPEPLMEDVALVRRIGAGRLRMLEVAAVTSAERYRRGGWLLRPLRNLSCLGLYLLGLPTPVIRRLYGR
jgi:rSAM/selenodomain-associated transferase 2